MMQLTSSDVQTHVCVSLLTHHTQKHTNLVPCQHLTAHRAIQLVGTGTTRRHVHSHRFSKSAHTFPEYRWKIPQVINRVCRRLIRHTNCVFSHQMHAFIQETNRKHQRCYFEQENLRFLPKMTARSQHGCSLNLFFTSCF